jgi:hypothetical protein
MREIMTTDTRKRTGFSDRTTLKLLPRHPIRFNLDLVIRRLPLQRLLQRHLSGRSESLVVREVVQDVRREDHVRSICRLLVLRQSFVAFRPNGTSTIVSSRKLPSLNRFSNDLPNPARVLAVDDFLGEALAPLSAGVEVGVEGASGGEGLGDDALEEGGRGFFGEVVGELLLVVVVEVNDCFAELQEVRGVSKGRKREGKTEDEPASRC